MLQNKAVLHLEKNDRIYQLLLSQESPLGEVYDALSEMRAYVIQRMNESQSKQEENKQVPNEG